MGQTVEPPHPLVSGSTLTEINASTKVGSGNPQVSFNPANASLDRVRVDSGGRVLTTNQGVPIADNQNSLKAGFRGPALLEDFILREKITHFDHERIPERIVHARGSAAHGFFECTKAIPELTRASLFGEVGKQTPHSLVWDEAVKISGADSDYHRRDLWEAIEAGAYPEWELGLQIFTEEQAEAFSFDVLDATKLVPEELVPIVPVGRRAF